MLALQPIPGEANAADKVRCKTGRARRSNKPCPHRDRQGHEPRRMNPENPPPLLRWNGRTWEKAQRSDLHGKNLEAPGTRNRNPTSVEPDVRTCSKELNCSLPVPGPGQGRVSGHRRECAEAAPPPILNKLGRCHHHQVESPGIMAAVMDDEEIESPWEDRAKSFGNKLLRNGLQRGSRP